MSGIVTTNAPYPPATTQIGDSQNGTLTGISCDGPCVCTIYSAAGVALHSISSQLDVNEALSIAFTGGPPTITQNTPSAINVSFS
ncbi:hypothetical protein AWB69_05977 [Caballeronia udeis]|uniref:Uncharacterized protein n=1 Tax=Caballeronia udeis TaxID=1232866 RepID=A0A158IH78_9BURK|nr:hypothetical protein [Caballeronia udeis]SAL55639.1 hypothetical protein AWB69_05977 [Caballeronia udeis]